MTPSRTREVRDGGAVLVRPDQHVCWRHEAVADDPQAELSRAMKSILAR